MASLFTLEKRSQYTSVIGMIWTVGTVCGPVIGGGLAQVSWVGYVPRSWRFMLIILVAWDILAERSISSYKFSLGHFFHAYRAKADGLYHDAA